MENVHCFSGFVVCSRSTTTATTTTGTGAASLTLVSGYRQVKDQPMKNSENINISLIIEYYNAIKRTTTEMWRAAKELLK